MINSKQTCFFGFCAICKWDTWGNKLVRKRVFKYWDIQEIMVSFSNESNQRATFG